MELALQNPWWAGKEDPHLKKWQAMEVQWTPSWLKQLSLEPFSLNFVVGPRQVGKTTGIKLLISELIKQHRPLAIVYLNVELMADIEAFSRFLTSLRKHKAEEKIDTLFIFLDEVSHLPGWWKIVKGLIDAGFFQDDVITATSSSSMKIRKEAELFSGRTGKGKEVTVLPLTFPELVKVKKIKKIETDRLEETMELYMRSGGFPYSLNSPFDAADTFVRGFESEMLKAGHSLSLTKEIIASVFRKAPSPLSYSSIAKDTSARSHKTITAYLETIKALFFLEFAHFSEKGRPNYRKERKVFFRDPFLVSGLMTWSGETPLESARYEWIVQEHLLRKYGEIYYYRNTYEIDCVSGGQRIEVKTGKPHRRYPKDVAVIEKEELPSFLLDLWKKDN